MMTTAVDPVGDTPQRPSAEGRRVRVGVVGAGPWARTHAAALAAHPDVELTGVWARRPEAAATLGEAHGVPAAATLDELFATCDAVDLCVPPDVQPAIAVEAARHGLHLLLEKPIAADLDAARAVVDACDEAGVVTQVMLTRRFHPHTRAFLAECAAELPPGRVTGVDARYVHGAFLGGEFATPWRLREGVLLDLGPHLFDLVEQVAGPVRELRAAGGHTLAVTTFHEDGAVGQLMLSGHSAGEATQEVVAFGEEGKHFFDAAPVDEPTCFDVAFREFAAAVRTGSPVVADAHRGLELQLLIEKTKAALNGD